MSLHLQKNRLALSMSDFHTDTAGRAPVQAAIRSILRTAGQPAKETPGLAQDPETSTSALRDPENAVLLEQDRTTRHQAIDMLAMLGTPPVPPYTSWEQTVGMFDDDSLIDDIVAAGQQIRESRRRR